MLIFPVAMSAPTKNSQRPPQRQDLSLIDPLELRIKMLRNHISGAEIARRLRVTRQAVNDTLLGKRKALLPKIEKMINALIAAQ